MKINFYTLMATFAFCCSKVMAEGAAPQGPAGLIEIVKFLPFLGIFYYFLIHQPKKKAKEHQEMLTQLTRGEKVITSGGLMGKIHSISKDLEYVSIEISPDVYVDVLKTAISPVKTAGSVASEQLSTTATPQNSKRKQAS